MTDKNKRDVDPRALRMRGYDDDEDGEDQNSQELDQAVDKTIEAATKMKDGAKKMGVGIWSGLKKGSKELAEKFQERKNKSKQVPSEGGGDEDEVSAPVGPKVEPSAQPCIAAVELQAPQVEQAAHQEEDVKPEIEETPTPVAEQITAPVRAPDVTLKSTKPKRATAPLDEDEEEEEPTVRTVKAKGGRKGPLLAIGSLVLAVSIGVGVYALSHFDGSQVDGSPVVKEVSIPKQFTAPSGFVFNQEVTMFFGKTWTNGFFEMEFSNDGKLFISVPGAMDRAEHKYEPTEDYKEKAPSLVVTDANDGELFANVNLVHVENDPTKPESIRFVAGPATIITLTDKAELAVDKPKVEAPEAKANVDTMSQPVGKAIAKQPTAVTQPTTAPVQQTKTQGAPATVVNAQATEPTPTVQNKPEVPQVAPAKLTSGSVSKVAGAPRQQRQAIAQKPTTEASKMKPESTRQAEKSKEKWQDKANSDLDAWARQF
ncbi:TPA: hypothetical protein UMA65_000432 [Stenotrophomonas maltophilia]|uniref:hypothetical protein n=1 Tax=Stenotrophomonas maltophilia TaxID=40324 RepID=UPI0013131135|nr:hypothetical protein [Stenotrophomonas maltophilia]HEL2981944.1 hypothetical protein [Stenotrophomonas maltophilia]